MQTSTSLPNHLGTTKHPLSAPSFSGSIQSHLSSLTGGTQRRLRLPDPPFPSNHLKHTSSKLSPRKVPELSQSGTKRFNYRIRTRFIHWPPILALKHSQPAWKRAAIILVRFVILGYLTLSMLLFATCIIGGYFFPPTEQYARHLISRSLPPRSTSLDPSPVAINSLQVLSRSPSTQHKDNETFASPSNLSITACTWSLESDIDLVPRWMTQWPGSISIVVSTFIHPSDSVSYLALVDRLRLLIEDFNATSNQRFDVHLLSLDEKTLESPSALLNLAHLFAYLDDDLTTHHVLFPAGLKTPPTEVYETFANYILKTPTTPGLIVQAGDMTPSTMLPPPSLAPVLIPSPNFELKANLQDDLDPGWCPERLLPPVDRTMDWALCVYALWLRAYGRMAYVPLPPGSEWPWIDPAMSGSIGTRINDQLSEKFVEETCVLAAKHLEALHEFNGGGDSKKSDTIEARWLRQACNDTLRGWGKGII